MKIWTIITLSAATATIGDGLLIGLIANGSDLVAFVSAHLPITAVFWLVLYTVVAMVLTTATLLADIRARRSLARVKGASGTYFRQLVFAQYFTGLFVLLGLGLYGEWIDELVVFGTRTNIAEPTLGAAVASVLGILGWLLVALTESLRGQGNHHQQSAEQSELPLLREILHLLRTQIRPETQASEVTVNSAEIIDAFEQSQRPMLQVLQELALAVTELRQSIGEIRTELGNGKPIADAESNSAFERAAEELQESVFALRCSTARLDEFITVLSAMKPDGDGTATIGVRLQVADELRGLLHEMNQKTLER